ncbi:hypothetical protein P154DRAFT_139511 [Amniculicola lignicola CBS 123094]|uniref:Uncharacterized protein n=1 Tax=Amniculicola lignicola CBS 123094 TaxID=1392246 RepID=A0A6A5WNK7_9PLEO|nr:hypothetical protein P154DRAFT_139511 [Amniculicola lignicola CBS 123094]
MERWGLHFAQLDARSHFNLTINTSAVNEVPWTQQNMTRTLIANLQLEKVQTLRTTHLTLGCFSLFLVLLTVHRIISDAKRAAAMQVPIRKQRFSSLHNVHPAETFPLVLACGAVIQQIVFVAVQSTSLRKVLSDKCRGIAMITFPAIFLMGYITLVFGIEMAIRGFRYDRFAPRGKWNTSICVSAVAFLSILTWIPTVATPMFDRCLGSLIWFPVRYELIALCILGVLVFSFFLLAAMISIQLMRTVDVEQNERIAASRMCYYLLMAAVIYILIIPVEIQAHLKDFMSTLATSRIAEISLFTSGAVIAFFHLFLRANASRMVIQPVGGASSATPKPKRPRIRFFGPSDLEMNISGPLALQGGRRPDSRMGLIDVGPEKNRYDFDPEYFMRSSHRPLSPGSMQSQALIDASKWPLPPDDEVPQENPGLHKRTKSSYSLFPTRAEDIPRLPATVYSPPKAARKSTASTLAGRRQSRRGSDAKSVTDITEYFSFLSKPLPLFAGKHGRNQSTDSSATVQIGLRFSVAPATLAAAKCTAANREKSPDAPVLRRDNSDSSSESLGLPIQSPSVHSTPSEEPNAFSFPEPPRSMSPAKMSPGKTPAFPVITPQNSSTYLQDQREKILPPTPRTALPSPLPSFQPQIPRSAPFSGLRMNPVSPIPGTPTSPPRSASTTRSPTALSPTAGIPLGAGTMARSPPPNGWI